MIYEIRLRESGDSPDDIDAVYDNPQEARDAFQACRDRFGKSAVLILRDNFEITLAQLSADIESYEIQAIRESETQLPSTYRQGWGGDSDVAMGSDGQTHGVWKPDNPEDNF